MGPVTVVRFSRKYRRSMNGAWMSGGTEASAPVVLESAEQLRGWTIGDGWLDVQWADGVKETVFGPDFPGYPPKAYGDRLRAVFALDAK